MSILDHAGPPLTRLHVGIGDDQPIFNPFSFRQHGEIMRRLPSFPAAALIAALGLVAPSAYAFEPADCTSISPPCNVAQISGAGPHTISALPSENIVRYTQGLPDLTFTQKQRIVFEFAPGANLINGTTNGHMAILGRGRLTYAGNPALAHYVGTGIAIGRFGSCFGVGIENFHLAEAINGNDGEPSNDLWSVIIKCKDVDFQDTLYRMTVDVGVFDVTWSLEELHMELKGGEVHEFWLPLASDRCRGGNPLPPSDLDMCGEVQSTSGDGEVLDSIRNRRYSDIAVADLGLHDWTVINLTVSSY